MAQQRAFYREQLHISFSQMNTYLMCPEKFRQQYVKRAPPSHRSPELIFGSAIHAALAIYHESIMGSGEKLGLQQVLDEFDALFDIVDEGAIPILWEDEGSREELSAQGHALLTLYYETIVPNKVLAVEKQFSMPLKSPRHGGDAEEALVGFIDLIEEDEDGTVWITELKSAARRYDSTRLRFDKQMSIYAAAKDAMGVPNAKMRFLVLLKTKEPAIETYEIKRGAAEIAETNHVISEVLRAIDQQIYYPLRSWLCSKCPYRATCGD